MQSLFLPPHLFQDVRAGDARAVLRWGERKIAPGPLRLIEERDRNRALTVLVTRVTDMPLRAAPEFLGKKRDWPDQALLDEMRKSYPEITLDHEVTVIEHLTPRDSEREMAKSAAGAPPPRR